MSFQDELNKLNQQNAYNAQLKAQQEAAARQASMQQAQQQQQQNGGLGGFLGSIAGGIGEHIGSFGNTLRTMIGGIGTGIQDLFGGNNENITYTKEQLEKAMKSGNQDVINQYKPVYDMLKDRDNIRGVWLEDGNGGIQFVESNEGKNTTKMKKDIYGLDENGRINYGKIGGQALTAASDVASFIPAGKALGAVKTIGAGAVGGFGDTYAKTGNQTDLAEALKNAGIGALASAATSGTNALLDKKKLVNNAISRDALSGAIGGGIGAGLGGGNILEGALQGAGQGAVTGIGESAIKGYGTKARNKIWEAQNNSNSVLGKVANTVGNSRALDVANTVGEKMLGRGVTDRYYSEYNPVPTQTEEVRVNDLERPTGWSGEEIDASKRNMLERAGKKLKNTAKSIKYQDVENSLSSKTAERVNANGSIEKLDKLGYKPGDYDRAAAVSEITNKFTDDLVAGANAKASNTNMVQDLEGMIDNQASAVSNTKNSEKYKNQIRKSIENARSNDPNSMDTYDVKKLLDESRRLGKLESEARKKSINATSGEVIDRDLAIMADAYGDARRYLRQQVDDNISWGDNYDKNVLRKRLENGGVEKKAINDVLNGENLSDIIRNTAKYEDARQMYKEMNTTKIRRNANAGEGSTKKQILDKSGVGKVVGTVLSPVGGVSSRAFNGLGNVLETIGQGANLSNSSSNIASAVGRAQGTTAAANQTLAARQEQQQPTTLESQLGTDSYNVMPDNTGYVGAPNAGGVSYNSAVGTGTGYNSGYSGTGNSMLDRLVTGMENALNAGDISAFSQLAEIYNTLSKVYGVDTSDSAKQTKLTESQQKANAAMDTLNQLEAMGNDTGNYWMSSVPIVGGLLTDITGGNEYTSVADSLALQLGFMLSGANVPNDEKERIKRNYIPLPTDSDAVKARKIMLAKQIINNFQNGYSSTPTDETNSYVY